MIITVTLNAAIDKSLSVPNFRLGRRHRTVEQTTMPGGKGVNVARVLKTLGAPVIATGLAGGATGTRLVEQLTDFAVLSDFVRIREESRTNTAVIDPTTGEQTEINERGPSVSAQEIDLFVDKLLYLAKGALMCVFAGSLPRNVDVDVYARLIRELKRLGVVTIVDTDFLSNTAHTERGGGARIRLTRDGEILRMDRVRFQNNQADSQGAALVLEAAGLVVPQDVALRSMLPRNSLPIFPERILRLQLLGFCLSFSFFLDSYFMNALFQGICGKG